VRNATKLPLVPLIVAEQAFGSRFELLISAQKGHQFKKIKHQKAQGCGEHGSVNRLAQHNQMSMMR
jgi:hypothetical protein